MILAKPSLTAVEHHYLEDAVLKNEIGVGEYVGKFEQAWATWNHKQYGVACNSGTNALYLALKALGIGPGDEVIVPEYTMVATAWAVSYTGAKPIFADCADDLLVHDFELGSEPGSTKAIIIVPIYGRPVPDSVYKKARRLGLKIIEDMAEAHGMRPKGDIACYSFYGNKILTTGEGGMCLTDNQEWADEMRSLANMYFDKERTMLHPKIGHNFRMTNLQAAIGLAQVERAYEILSKREKITEWYDQNLPEGLKMPRREVLWMYDFKVPDNEKAKLLLENRGVPSRYGFKPMSQQPMYLKPYEHLNAYRWSKRILYLPTYNDLTREEVKTICQKVRSVLG